MDAVLTRDGPVAAPLDYLVPSSGEIVPRSVRATIDGSGAGAAFYATLQVLSPSGRVMFSAISTSIAAGASADVSWFPRVGGGGSATVTITGLQLARVNIVGAQSVTAGDPGHKVTWGEAPIDTGSPSAFWSNVNPTRFTAPVDGYYLSHANLEYDVIAGATGVNLGCYLYKNGAPVSPPKYLYEFNTPNVNTTSYTLQGGHHGWFQLTAGDYLEILAYVQNLPGVPAAVTLIDLRPSENHYSSWNLLCIPT